MNQNQRCEVLKRSLQLRKEGYPTAEAEFIATQDLLQFDKNARAVKNEAEAVLEKADKTGGALLMWVFYSFVVVAGIAAIGFKFA